MSSDEMQAEILFLDPTGVKPATAVLVQQGFTVEVLDWLDPCGPTVWIMARTSSELDQNHFFNRISRIVNPLGGDVVVAGFARNFTGFRAMS